MTEEVGVIRDERSLVKALATIGALERDNSDRRLANMLTTAKLITAAALEREESRGAHFRSDYPTPNDRLARRSFLTLAEAGAIAREAAGARVSAPRRRAPARTALHA
jgi:L-aspartate oxidase